MKTEFKQSQALSEEGLFRAAFDNAEIGMALVSSNGKSLAVNNSICRITGYTKENLLQQTFLDITHPDDVEKDRLLSRQLWNGEKDQFEMEKRYLHKNGQIIWVLLTASIIRDTNNKPVYLIGQVRDITEKKQKEIQFNQINNDLDSVLNKTRTVIARLNRECRYLYINPAIEKEIGIPAPKIKGNPLVELNISDSALAKIKESVHWVFQTKQDQIIEFSNEARENPCYYYAYFIPEFDENGEIETVLAFFQNVTQLKNCGREQHKNFTKIKQMREILPICSYCRDVRDENDAWSTLENYVVKHTNKRFSHGICQDCYEIKVKPELIARGIKITNET